MTVTMIITGIITMKIAMIMTMTKVVLPILTYGLAVYGASDSDLNVIQRFLDRCHKRHFTSSTVSILDLLEQQDKSAFKRAINNHMLQVQSFLMKKNQYIISIGEGVTFLR